MRISYLCRAAIIAVLAHASASHAHLGGNVSSVNTDQSVLRATRMTECAQRYTIHQMTLPRGTLVREYVSPAGVVFGVSWHGPVMPNLKQILGSYSTEAGSGAKAFREKHPGLGPVLVANSNLSMVTAGHMGGYVGHAFLRQSMPAGVTGRDIK